MPKFVSPSAREYTQTRILGTGAFGTILVCRDSEKKDFIMKRVRLARQTPQERHASVQELAMMQQLKHSNLIQGIDGWVVFSLSYSLFHSTFAAGVVLLKPVVFLRLSQVQGHAGEQTHRMPCHGELQWWRFGIDAGRKAWHQTSRAGRANDDCAGAWAP
jgi:hypothetical protein